MWRQKDENSGGGGVGDEVRQKQLTLLRRIHIPALCSNMIHMLQASQHLPACLQLADCVASERHQLYKVNTAICQRCDWLCWVDLTTIWS